VLLISTWEAEIRRTAVKRPAQAKGTKISETSFQ
jgi:hypothetical protein